MKEAEAFANIVPEAMELLT